jgi:hypothetical protein
MGARDILPREISRECPIYIENVRESRDKTLGLGDHRNKERFDTVMG